MLVFGVNRSRLAAARAFGMSWCALKWKIRPQDNYIKKWPPALEARARGEKSIKAIGYDYDEEHRSSKVEDDVFRFYYPLREWGWNREECVARREQEGVPPPGKSVCFYCPSSTKLEILALSREHPDLYARAVAIEDNWLNGKAAKGTVEGLGRHYAWKALPLLSEAEQKELPNRPVESCSICVEESD